MIYLCNAFSVNMLPGMWVGEGYDVRIERISAKETGRILRDEEWVSVFGHEYSAYHLSRYLQIRVPVSRDSFKLTPDDILLAAVVESRRLWEQGRRGCPEFKFYRVYITERKPAEWPIVEEPEGLNSKL